ncbi:AraC family transcriptional regulator [Paenibacillus ihumii]|uniref:AraC family transcriptional regulator n=1 Tax=Paenibacillus ihumii TaxID=687436 RepID=UPI0006D7C367|nr:AraC family transcriptional regulator [Paenibacillus ihumii]
MLSEQSYSAGPCSAGDEQNVRKELSQIKKYMEEHFHEPLTIAQLALMANISPKYFVDLFKKSFGKSAMKYLSELRINQAKRYLLSAGEQLRLRDIALMVGYSDEFYFSRKFKKEVGMSPSDYIRKARPRVAACSPEITGLLLALDIIPVAAPLDPKWTAYYYNDYRTRISSHLQLAGPYNSRAFEANLAKLALLRPDAIIGTDQLDSSEQAKLSSLAQTFFVPAERCGWREQLRMLAGFLNREEKAEQWVEQHELKVQAARSEIRGVLGSDSLMVLRIYGDQLHMYGNRGIGEVLYEDLHIRPACPASSSGSRMLPIEELAVINPDRILVVVCAETASRSYWLSLQHSRQWRQLQAVKNGQIHLIPSDPWFEYSPMAVSRMLDEALLMFTGKCPYRLQDTVHGAVRGT